MKMEGNKKGFGYSVNLSSKELGTYGIMPNQEGLMVKKKKMDME